MKIALLDSIPDHQGQRGVTRCFDELAKGLIANGTNQCTWISRRPAPKDATPKRNYSTLLNNLRKFKVRTDRLSGIIADYGRYDIVLDAYYSPFVAKTKRALITYDMIYEMCPQSFPKDRADVVSFIKQKEKCIRQSKWVVCISDHTRRDLIKIYPDVEPKCYSMHLGMREVCPSRFTFNQTKPYILFVGQRAGYKNFIRCLIAFGKSDISKTHDLIVASPTLGPSEEEHAVALEFGISGSIRYLKSPSDEDVAWLYSQAVALFYPSLYEGFGFPVVEGMRYRTLVICGMGSSMEEIAGGYARTCNPVCTQDMANALRWATNLSASERDAWITNAYSHSLSFTWESCANNLDKILKN